MAIVAPILKRRRLRVSGIAVNASKRAYQRIGQMPGVASVLSEKGILVVEYDLRQTTLAQIEAAAISDGLEFRSGLHWLQRALWRFTERNELDNAVSAGDGACCNHPPARWH